MAVIKKRGNIDLSEELTAIRNSITDLSEDDMAATKKPSSAKKKPAKAPAKKVAKTNGAATEDGTSLADICAKAKVETHTARVRLRNADVKKPGSRWVWTRQADVDRVTKIIKGE